MQRHRFNKRSSKQPQSAGQPAETYDPAFMPDASQVPYSERHKLLKRTVFWLGMLLGPVVLLALVALGIGYFRLRQGPIELAFLKQPIEQGIAREFDGLTPSMSGVVVTLNAQHGLEFQLQDLRLKNKTGGTVASAPSAAFELDIASLLSGQVAPARVDFIEPRLFLNYSRSTGLTLNFDTASEGAPPELIAPPTLAARPPESERNAAQLTEGATGQTIDLLRVFSETSRHARETRDTAGHLSALGLRDATLILDYEGERSIWHVPAFEVDVNHAQKQSVISGSGRVLSPRGPWSLSFYAEDNQDEQLVTLKTSVRDLVPRTVAAAAPELGVLQALNMPVAADSTVAFRPTGEVLAADVKLALGRGQFVLPGEDIDPLKVDEGLINLLFEPETNRMMLKSSVLRSGLSQIRLDGEIVSKIENGVRTWPFKVAASDGWLGGGTSSAKPLPLEQWQLTGHVRPDESQMVIDDFVVGAGGGRIGFRGVFDYGSDVPAAKISGQFSAMSMPAFKVLWPSPLAVDARVWVDAQVDAADLKTGTFSYKVGRYFAEDQPGADKDGWRLSVTMEFSDVVFRPAPGMHPVTVPRALLRLENDTLEVAAPDAVVKVDQQQTLEVKASRFAVSSLFDPEPLAEVNFTGRGAAKPVFDVLDRPPLQIFNSENGGARPKGVTGDFEGSVKLSFPLLKELPRERVKVDAQVKLSNGKIKGVFGGKDVRDASIDFDITHKTLEAKGVMLVAGVTSDVSWQHIFDADLSQQPPIRISSTLDASDRRQLGIEINEWVSGNVPVELTLKRRADEEFDAKLRADFTETEIQLSGIGWRKPPGRTMFLQTDIGTGNNNRKELQNFTLRGDKLSAEGWLAFDKKDKLTEFYFPVFTLDVVSKLKLRGKRRADGIWKVQADGPTFNGQNFFRSLFSLGRTKSKSAQASRQRSGVDLVANIKSVIGFSDQTIRGLKVSLSKRGGRLTNLDAKGTLESGKPVAVKLVGKGRARQLRADSTDAGRVFKLVGFYPNVRGGRVRLEVNLDGQGAAEKTGILWVDKFQILSDPIVTEVVEGGQQRGGKRKRGQTRTVREVYDFDRMKAPFSVGHDQFVLKDSYFRGPLIGASIRGKVDYRAKRLSLGGTYIPLQGLNNALGEIPLIGQILSGPRGEGIFGITFAVSGAMSNPQVIVNPLSLVTPGIFRELMQITPYNPTVQPRGAPQKQKNSKKNNGRARASSAPAKGAPGYRRQQRKQGTIDGWSSQTIGPR